MTRAGNRGARPPAARRRRQPLGCCAVLAIAAVSSAVASAEPISTGAVYEIRTYSCIRTAVPPVIDGDPSDACWQEAHGASDFLLHSSEQPATHQTSARLLYDDRNLYVAATCTEPNVDRITAQPQQRDGAVWLDDSVEVFLDCNHDHETYFQFIISAAGSLLDGMGRDSWWNARGARCAASKGKGSWSMELQVPFMALDARAPSDGEAWGVNIWRNNYASAEGQSQWSCVAPDSGHAPMRWGDLIFGEARYSLQSVIFGDVYQGSSMIKAQLRGHAGASPEAAVSLDVTSDSGAFSSAAHKVHLTDDATAWLSTTYDVRDTGPARLTIQVTGPDGGTLPYQAAYPILPLGWRVAGLGLLSIKPNQACYADSMPVRATLERLPGAESAATLPHFSVELAVCSETGEPVTEARIAQLTAADAPNLRLTREWDVADLPDGRYAVTVSVKNDAGDVIGSSSRPIVKMQSLYSTLGLAQPEADLALALPRAEQAPESPFASCVATAEFHLKRARDQFAALSLQDTEDQIKLWWMRLDAQEARRWTEPLASGRLPFANATGRILRASRSRIDGTLQPYSVFVPSKYNPATPSPLALILHPFDPEYGPFWEDWIGVYEYWAEVRGQLLLCPFARGNQDYRGIGEADLWQAYEETRRLYNIDSDRVYATGFSMGGTGTWHLAARWPDRFAAVAAVSGRGGNIRQLMLNAALVPTYVVHGGADDVVPPEHAQAMVAAARRAGARAFLSWHPFAGHVLFPDETRNVFDWFAQSPRQGAPRQVTYRTDTLKYDRSHWVRIDALGEGRRTPEIEAAIGEGNAITVRTLNVDAYTLTPPPELIALGAGITVRTNGAVSYEGPLPDEGLSLRRVRSARDEFELAPDGGDGEEGLRKRHGLQGPLCDAFTAPFLYVYGTGDADPALAVASEAAARAARDTMESAAHGSFPIKPDAAVTADDIINRNLILYGTPAVNSLMNSVASGLPICLEGGRLHLRDEPVSAPSAGAKMIYPNPLCSDRYIVVNLGADADALQALAELRVLYVDYIVIGRQEPGVPYECLRDGNFDQQWQLPTVDGGDVRIVTDTSWRCHPAPPAGWTAPEFDDTDWPRAAANTKGLWPDINFATHFDDRAVAIWYPEPDPDQVTRYFRLTFELPSTPRWARATVLVEDECELYVNGLRVGRIGYEEGVATVSLRRYLRPGKNVLAAKVSEVFGDQGLVIDCVIRLGGEDAPA